MKRALIYLAIFALAANVAVFSLAYLTNPFLEQGQSNNQLVISFLITCFAAITFTAGLAISILKTFRPSHKLPHLLIRDSLILSSLISLGCTGLLVLQLLRAATVVNMLLWLVIIIATIWIARSMQKAVDQPSTNKRLPIIDKRHKT